MVSEEQVASWFTSILLGFSGLCENIWRTLVEGVLPFSLWHAYTMRSLFWKGCANRALSPVIGNRGFCWDPGGCDMMYNVVFSVIKGTFDTFFIKRKRITGCSTVWGVWFTRKDVGNPVE